MGSDAVRSDPRAKALAELKREISYVIEWLRKPEGRDYTSSLASLLEQKLKALLAAESLPEPETPKVERVEIWSDSRNANARLYVNAESRYFRKEDGWKFYAERPLPPLPKKEEPTNEELAQLLEGLAESYRFNNETNRHNTHLAAARLRSMDRKEKGP